MKKLSPTEINALIQFLIIRNLCLCLNNYFLLAYNFNDGKIIFSYIKTVCCINLFLALNLDTNVNFRKILVEQVSSDWIRFGHIIYLNGFYNIIEEIHNKNNNNQLKLEKFLQKITEINQGNYNEVIANSLYALKRFDILLCVALDGKRSNLCSV